jgi:hypothetical protein
MTATELLTSFEAYVADAVEQAPGDYILKYSEKHGRYVRNHTEQLYQAWLKGRRDGFGEGFMAAMDSSIAPPTAADLTAQIYGIPVYSAGGGTTLRDDNTPLAVPEGVTYTWASDSSENLQNLPKETRDTRIGINDEIAPELKGKRIRDWGFE